MKQILKYLKEYKKECICAPLFKLLEASFELIVPLVMAAIIDNGIAASDKPYIWKMGGVLVLLAAVGLVSSVTAQYFAAKAAVGFSTKLRHILFEKIESLSFSKMDTVGTSTLITRMTSDINQVQSGVNLVLRLFLRSPFIVFGAMAMAFTVNVRAAMVFVVTIPLLSIVVFSVMAASLPLYKKVQSSLDTVLSHTRENLEGTRVIRAFNKQNDEIDSFNSDNELLTNMQQVVGRISALTNPLTFIIINIATIAVIVSGGKQVYAGILTQGEVVALVNYMSQILVELIKLANLIVQVTKAVACGNRIADVLSIPSKLPEKNPKLIGAKDGAPEVEFDHVCMTYEGAADETLTDISFTVQKGQTIGIIGGTGSGKTTLLNVLSLFIPEDERVITVEDSAELKLTHPNLVNLEARPANIEGKGRISIRDLVINTLRMRPDRIIVGECRGAEALDMLQAMNTGHDGSLTTAHANNPRDALARLENMVMMAGFEHPSTAIREQIASALDIIVQQTRLVDGSRKVVKITEVTGREGNQILLQDIFTFEQTGLDSNGKVQGYHTATGNIPIFIDELRKSGRLNLDMSVFVPKV